MIPIRYIKPKESYIYEAWPKVKTQKKKSYDPDKIAAAEEKRARKNAKRVRDYRNSE